MIAVCSGPESRETSIKIANNLREKGHLVSRVSGGIKKYLKAVIDSDAILVVNDGGEVSPELVVAMILADYFGKDVLATREPESGALSELLSSIKVKVVR